MANGGISRDGRTLTYHLVHNARWHDGAPVTAADVIYTWQQVMNPNNNVVTRTGYDRSVAIDAPHPYTVRVHLRAPYAPAVDLFAAGDVGTIIARHILARYANLNQVPFATGPLGSGPYIFRSWTHGSTMRFDANPGYFRGADEYGVRPESSAWVIGGLDREMPRSFRRTRLPRLRPVAT